LELRKNCFHFGLVTVQHRNNHCALVAANTQAAYHHLHQHCQQLVHKPAKKQTNKTQKFKQKRKGKKRKGNREIKIK
jgi:hypothetical protein